MTVFHVVRHAEHVLQDKVMVGRTPGVALSDRGRAQAAQLGARFHDAAVCAVVTSPRRRARETAAAIATATGAMCEIAIGLDEADIGDWTGRTLADLEHDPRWRRWNVDRAESRCPGGESMADIWARVSEVFAQLHERWPQGTLVLVSHAEPIRAAVLATTGRSFDDYHAIDIAPASVTTFVQRDGTLRIADVSDKIAA